MVVAGGDGSQLWVVGMVRPIFKCAFAIFPLGTGNELGRVTGWGNGFGKLPKMERFFQSVREANAVIDVDQWDMKMKLKRHVDILNTPERVFKTAKVAREAYEELLKEVDIPEDKKDDADEVERLILQTLEAKPELRELADKAVSLRTQFVLFFSMGFDAKIANRFHELREKEPDKKRSRGANKAWHGVYGAQELFSKTRNVTKFLNVEVDGRQVELPKSLGTLQIFSVHSSSDGIYFWGKTKSGKKELQEFTKPYINDGLLEVAGTRGVFHLVSIRSAASHSARIAQGASIKLDINEDVPAQLEGEPWIQQPCHVEISPYDTVPVLRGPGKVRNVNGEDRDVGDEVGICSKIFPCCCGHYEPPPPRNMQPAENNPNRDASVSDQGGNEDEKAPEEKKVDDDQSVPAPKEEPEAPAAEEESVEVAEKEKEEEVEEEAVEKKEEVADKPEQEAVPAASE